MIDLALIALAVSDAARIAELCSPVLPPPSTGGLARRPCRVSKLSVGNSNSLYRLDVGDESYLAREFGTNAALDLNRARENEIFARLAAAKIAPGMLGTFEGGRVEEWVDGGPCSADECRSADVAEAVARRLAALHAFDDGAAEPWAISTATEWLDGAQRCAKALEDPRSYSPVLARRARKIDLGGVAARIDECHDSLSSLPQCFCHNDLSNTNVHRDGQTTRLIDFEFAGRNYRGFDLAVHFSHWAGGAVDGRYDDAAFPTAAEQRPFLEAYAAADGGVTAEALAEEIRAALPLAHLVWGLWALCALPAAAAAGKLQPFSHIEYAERRLAAYEAAL